MKKLLALSAVFALLVSLTGCATVEQDLQNSNALLLSAREVREIFSGNTFTAVTGDTFYLDIAGGIAGKGPYGAGGVLRGSWNITDDGRICTSNWNSSLAPTGCFKVYFDNATQMRKLVDLNGELKWTVINVVTGNPNNF